MSIGVSQMSSYASIFIKQYTVPLAVVTVGDVFWYNKRLREYISSVYQRIVKSFSSFKQEEKPLRELGKIRPDDPIYHIHTAEKISTI